MNEIDLVKRLGRQKLSTTDNDAQTQQARNRLIQAIDQERATGAPAKSRTRAVWRPSRKLLVATAVALAVPGAYAVANSVTDDDRVIELTLETAEPAPAPGEGGEMERNRGGPNELRGKNGVIRLDLESASPAENPR